MTAQTWSRSSGLFLAISSLPGDGHTGDFGLQAQNFLRFLREARVAWWQVLPLNPLGYGNSPYSAISSFALEPIYIDLDIFRKAGLIANTSGTSVSQDPTKAAYAKARQERGQLYREAFHNWQKKRGFGEKSFRAFCQEHRDWLDDYSLFCALGKHYGHFTWHKWPEGLCNRNEKDLKEVHHEFAEAILYERFLQYYTYSCWQRVREQAHSYGIGIFGDMPIYPALDSCDVWVEQDFFHLDPISRRPTEVAGVPPDIFNESGQKWGHPLYDWNLMERDGFRWWKTRIKHQLKLYDAIRLDHFIGYYHHWSIPAEDQDARQGRWRPSKGRELLTALKDELGSLAIIAEDLGDVSPEVFALRDELGLAGMKVLQFAFGKGSDAIHKPHHFARQFVAYTGTHDTNTSLAWFKELMAQQPQVAKDLCQYFASEADDIVWAMIRSLYASVTDLVIIPMQDVLELDEKSRINYPGKIHNNWEWRMTELDLAPYGKKLAEFARIYERSFLSKECR